MLLQATALGIVPATSHAPSHAQPAGANTQHSPAAASSDTAKLQVRCQAGSQQALMYHVWSLQHRLHSGLSLTKCMRHQGTANQSWQQVPHGYSSRTDRPCLYQERRWMYCDMAERKWPGASDKARVAKAVARILLNRYVEDGTLQSQPVPLELVCFRFGNSKANRALWRELGGKPSLVFTSENLPETSFQSGMDASGQPTLRLVLESLCQDDALAAGSNAVPQVPMLLVTGYPWCALVRVMPPSKRVVVSLLFCYCVHTCSRQCDVGQSGHCADDAQSLCGLPRSRVSCPSPMHCLGLRRSARQARPCQLAATGVPYPLGRCTQCSPGRCTHRSQGRGMHSRPGTCTQRHPCDRLRAQALAQQYGRLGRALRLNACLGLPGRGLTRTGE